ncbi:hypothetical protein AAP_05883 [Ascosphaera apis ARSEF 7405]|uniref:Uncharacterized protein n=1 Tax=Ascosphaera apis ARSEF 7405 TaxID=392613 RepID=A0A167V6V4_9EURO|nr:hypothetical protein AAP_05883 [Ascosphaera apis ARSEF 7405]
MANSANYSPVLSSYDENHESTHQPTYNDSDTCLKDSSENLVSPSLHYGETTDTTLRNSVTQAAGDFIHDSRDNDILRVFGQGSIDIMNLQKAFDGRNEISGPRPIPVSQWDDVRVEGTWLDAGNSSYKWENRPLVNSTLVYPHLSVISVFESEENRDRIGLAKNQSSGNVKLGIGTLSPSVNTICTLITLKEVDVWNNFSDILDDWTNEWQEASDEQDDELQKAIYEQTDDLQGTSIEQYVAKMNGALSEPGNMPIKGFAQLFDWAPGLKRPPNLSNVTSRELGLVNIYITPVGFRQMSAYAHITISTLMDKNETVVCKIEPRFVDGCTSRYHYELAHRRLVIACEDNKPKIVIPPLAYTGDWATQIQGSLDNVFGASKLTESPGSMSLWHDTSGDYENLTSPGTPSPAEVLSVASAPLGLSGTHATSIRKLYMTEEGPNPPVGTVQIPLNESCFASAMFTTYRSRGSIQRWQNILFIPLGTVCALSFMALIYLCLILFRKQPPNINEPKTLFQLGVGTGIKLNPVLKNLDEEFGSNWIVAEYANGMHYAYASQHNALADSDKRSLST